MLTEYLYRDDRRLLEYASQICPSLTVVEKAREWTVGVALTGPKAEGKQSERVRPMTEHEKVELVYQYLRDSSAVFEPAENLVMQHYLDCERSFFSETLVARKIHFPGEPLIQQEPFAFWVSTRPARDGARSTRYHGKDNVISRVLLESASYPEGPPKLGSSGFSAFSEIFQATRTFQQQSVINEMRWYAREQARRNGEEFVWPEHGSDDEFFENTVDFCKIRGWRVSEPRSIRTVYRVRALGSFHRSTIFGYPLWIIAA